MKFYSSSMANRRPLTQGKLYPQNGDRIVTTERCDVTWAYVLALTVDQSLSHAGLCAQALPQICVRARLPTSLNTVSN